MSKVSVAGARRAAMAEDVKTRDALAKHNKAALEALRTPNPKRKIAGTSLGAVDSFVNFAHKLGMGADNAMSAGTYGYNPITRNRQLLEWIYRGSWLGGVAVDVVADDMTRKGINFVSEMDPTDQEKVEQCIDQYCVWDKLNEALKWARLYGGALAVMLVDGQDLKTPLKTDTIAKDQFKGVLPLDRWMVEPDLTDLVTEYGPYMGQPKYYKVMANAPALRGAVIHYTRVLRFLGIEMPYQQALTENLWGISILERLYDRMVAFDTASAGAGQLVFKSHLRTLKIKGLRDIVAAGGTVMNGLYAYTEVMRRFQGIEGVSLIDGDDEFDVQGVGNAMSGVSDVLLRMAEQVSGALRVPLTRLFGQTPSGLNGGKDETGERNYDEYIGQQQQTMMLSGTTAIYRLAALSAGVKLPDNFAIGFASLRELSEEEKAKIAKDTTDAVIAAKDATLLSQQSAMKELRQSSRVTGIYTNISKQDIDAADDELQPPMGEDELMQMGAELDGKAAEKADARLEDRNVAAHERNLEAQKAAGADDKKPKPRAKTKDHAIQLDPVAIAAWLKEGAGGGGGRKRTLLTTR